MAMIRHRAAKGSDVPTRLLYSSRSYEEIIYREELENLAARDGSLEVSTPDPLQAGGLERLHGHRCRDA